MIWYKAWLDTRWRFLIGLVLLVCSAAGVVLTYPQVASRLSGITDLSAGIGGRLGAEIQEGLTLSRDYRGYVWWQWFRANLRETWTMFAVLLGTGGLVSQTAGGGALFTLSLPASRRRLLSTRAATGLTELAVLAVVPSLAIPVLSPAIGQSFSAVDATVHALCLLVSGAVFFSLASLLSTVFRDVWRPALITLAVFYALAFVDTAAGAPGFVALMTGERYLRSGELPWGGLLAAGATSAALLYAAARNLERRDF